MLGPPAGERRRPSRPTPGRPRAFLEVERADARAEVREAAGALVAVYVEHAPAPAQAARRDGADRVAVAGGRELARLPRAAVMGREPLLDLVPVADRAREVDEPRILVVERRAAGGERVAPGAGSHDLAPHPARAVEVREVERVVVGDPARVHDARLAVLERDVMAPRAPAAIRVAVDRVEVGDVQRHGTERAEAAPARREEAAVLVAHVEEAVLEARRVPVGEDAVDPRAPVAGVLGV